MKPRRGCESCRKRHIKCVTEEGSSECKGCKDKGLSCHFGPKFTFKHVRHLSSSSAPTVQDADDLNSEISTSRPAPQQDDTASRHVDSGNTEITGVETVAAGGLQTPQGSTFTFSIGPRSEGTITTGITEEFEAPSPSGIINQDESSRSIQTIASPIVPRSHEHQIASTPKEVGGQVPLLSQHEASLLRLYIRNIAPSPDACDEGYHFGTVIPRLALQEPILLYGLLALAARYESLRNSSPGLEATYYHNKQIELLIGTLNKPEETYNAVLLSAVVISRLYEEYDPDDDAFQHHLQGTSQLLSHRVIVRFVEEGGLAEAASWVHLRQAIYVSIVTWSPVRATLDNWASSTAFKRDDDGAYANRAVFLMLKCLKLFFPTAMTQSPVTVSTPGTEHLFLGDWERVIGEVDEWFSSRPKSFHPVHYEKADPSRGKPFPEVWMLAAANVIGMHYYHASKILYYLFRLNSPSDSVGYQVARERRDNERIVGSHLCTLMGLTLSNPEVLNAYFLPSHLLSICGYCLRHPVEREHTIKYLQKVKAAVAWKVDRVIDNLREQWRELDELDGR